MQQMSEKIRRQPSVPNTNSVGVKPAPQTKKSNGGFPWLTLSLFFVALSMFVLIPIDPEVVTESNILQRLDNLNQSLPPTSKVISRKDVFFPCGQGDKCHGWLYTPKQIQGNAKLVLMGCGMGAPKVFGMEKYASKFAAAGYAVFLFDYRGFGASFGLPRNRIGPFKHLEDWRSAIQHLLKSGEFDDTIDVSQVALWGTSFAGGHVLSIAAELANTKEVKVSAVISQMPFLDGNRSAMKNMKERGLSLTLRLVLSSIQDHMRSFVGLPPAMIRIIGLRGSLAYMNVIEEQLDVYLTRLPKVIIGGWKNLAPARGIIEIRNYSPVHLLEGSHVTAPVLFVGALKDELCPIEWFQLARSQLHGVIEDHTENCTHFEIYGAPYFETSSDRMIDFLKKHF